VLRAFSAAAFFGEIIIPATRRVFAYKTTWVEIKRPLITKPLNSEPSIVTRTLLFIMRFPS
jgi:hypothetical protein